MKFLRKLPCIAVILLLASCAPPNIPLQPLPTLKKAVAPAPPAIEKKNVHISYPKKGIDSTALEENTTVKGGFKVPLNSRVVISVPVEQQEVNSRSKEDTPENADNLFQTAENFSQAEQEIEKSLLRKGFTVLDRSKFEAELRNRRTEDRWVKTTKAKEEEIKALEEQRDAKRITREEYVEKLQDVESKYTVFEKNGTRAAGDRELVDIGELIRAAERGNVQADFILQVNRFEVGQISDKRVYLPDNKLMKGIIDSDLKILKTLEAENKTTITKPGYFGYLNAKLIEVKTGSIVWVGEHRVESSDATDIFVDLSINKVPSNVAAVNKVASDYNRKLAELVDRAKKEARTVGYVNYDIKVRNSAKVRYDAIFNELSSMSPYNLTYPQWQYVYEISAPKVSPAFPSANELRDRRRDAEKTGNYNSFLALKDYAIEHQNGLAKTVSKQLISTIPATEY